MCVRSGDLAKIRWCPFQRKINCSDIYYRWCGRGVGALFGTYQINKQFMIIEPKTFGTRKKMLNAINPLLHVRPHTQDGRGGKHILSWMWNTDDDLLIQSSNNSSTNNIIIIHRRFITVADQKFFWRQIRSPPESER